MWRGDRKGEEELKRRITMIYNMLIGSFASPTNRTRNLQIASFSNRQQFCRMFCRKFAQNSTDKSKVPEESETKNRRILEGQQLRIATFPCFRNRCVFRKKDWKRKQTTMAWRLLVHACKSQGPPLWCAFLLKLGHLVSCHSKRDTEDEA